MKIRVLRRNRSCHQRELTDSATWVMGVLGDFLRIRLDLLPVPDTSEVLRNSRYVVFENYPIAEAA